MKKKPTNATINVRGTEITVIHHEDDDFISLTDMVRNFDGGPALIEQWLTNKDTVLFLGVWERLNNPDFKTPEFEEIKNEAGRNSVYLSAKINYRIHTDAIQTHLIPAEVTAQQASLTYANEADLLNVALFGLTAREWRDANPGKEGNMRDHATLEQLLVLANLENRNAELIHMGLPQGDRLKRLNAIAIRQMQTLTARTPKQLKGGAE